MYNHIHAKRPDKENVREPADSAGGWAGGPSSATFPDAAAVDRSTAAFLDLANHGVSKWVSISVLNLFCSSLGE